MLAAGPAAAPADVVPEAIVDAGFSFFNQNTGMYAVAPALRDSLKSVRRFLAFLVSLIAHSKCTIVMNSNLPPKNCGLLRCIFSLIFSPLAVLCSCLSPENVDAHGDDLIFLRGQHSAGQFSRDAIGVEHFLLNTRWCHGSLVGQVDK